MHQSLVSSLDRENQNDIWLLNSWYNTPYVNHGAGIFTYKTGSCLGAAGQVMVNIPTPWSIWVPLYLTFSLFWDGITRLTSSTSVYESRVPSRGRSYTLVIYYIWYIYIYTHILCICIYSYMCIYIGIYCVYDYVYIHVYIYIYI